jgi:two-component system response regulator NreC
MRIVLADDHRMVREGLRAVLERAGVEVIGEAASGREAIAEARRLHPDVVVMDVAMPDLNGIDATRRLHAELPEIKIIGLSMNSDRRYVLAMLDAGAAGYLLKNAASDELLSALAIVTRGQTYLSPTIAEGVVDEALDRGPSSHRGLDGPLTAREREVLQLIAEGYSSKEADQIRDPRGPDLRGLAHRLPWFRMPSRPRCTCVRDKVTLGVPALYSVSSSRLIDLVDRQARTHRPW